MQQRHTGTRTASSTRAVTTPPWTPTLTNSFLRFIWVWTGVTALSSPVSRRSPIPALYILAEEHAEEEEWGAIHARSTLGQLALGPFQTAHDCL